jgi:hypothetical protein
MADRVLVSAPRWVISRRGSIVVNEITGLVNSSHPVAQFGAQGLLY